MRTLITLTAAILGLGACTAPVSKRETYDLIKAEMAAEIGKLTQNQAQAAAVSAALLPPLVLDLPKVRQPQEERFSIAFNNVPATQFFLSVVSGTRYNVLVHPDVAGNISATLKDVTLFEALDAIREVYGYDYKVEGTRIYIKSLTMQTRVFQVNYLTGNRKGASEIRVSSGSVTDNAPGSTNAGNANSGNSGNNNNSPGSPGGGSTSRSLESSRISTTSNSDFWVELKASLEAIVGTREGHSVVISPQSGVVVIRALPEELRNVEQYLKATQISVDRQVILEAKILEVQLNDSYQTGINWAAFGAFNGGTQRRISTGFVTPGTNLTPLPGNGAVPGVLASGGDVGISTTTGVSLGAAANAAGSLFGLAFQTANFAALISFLESQGTVHVLSSPRIATLNNQKAVLKIGTDEFFVTGVTTNTTTGTGNTNPIVSPSVTLQPFFSGVVLDVTPQIDDHGNVILHVHPQVSQVSTVNKRVDLGTNGSISLPLASSTTSETDSVVRGQDGRVVAIGGLMRQSATSDRSQVPGVGDVPGLGALFKNTGQVSQKRELVILLKPTVIQNDGNWTDDLLQSQRQIQAMEPVSPGGHQ
jgi:MSHA biogenesis protein MshL